MKNVLYDETIVEPESEGFIASHCSVWVDEKANFFHVETDPYEGSAQFTLPVAIKVHEALGRAILAAQDYWMQKKFDEDVKENNATAEVVHG